ncbi:formyltetrahydrofolate deformylase [Helicobacter sp. T3_23-1059]
MRYTLLISTHDSAGLVYKISRVLYEAGANIQRQDEYVDSEHNLFFLRTCFVVEVCNDSLDFSGGLNSKRDCHERLSDSRNDSTLPITPSAREGEDSESVLDCKFITDIQDKLKSILPSSAQIALKKASKKSLVILATKENHCLGDLLLREESGELNAKIKAVIANRADLRDLVERFRIPFFWVDSEGISRQAHEAKLREIIDRFSPDLLALAKYMRILSPDFVARYAGKIINIHHSFLPAFIGANPYKQAHQRGVKIIGATAHFVTDKLDEGPIIAQDIIHINHAYSWRDMQKAGRDVEKSVFAHALDLVLNDRVFVSGNKTIVF